MATVTGIVEAASKNKYGYGIMVNGGWYNSKWEIKASKGDEVEFDDGGKTYVQKLRIVKAADGGSTAPVGSKASTGNTSYRGVFPLAPNDGSRSIVRQNALTNSTNLLLGLSVGKDLKVDDAIKTILKIAREFEYYTSGDVDSDAKKAIEETFEVT